MKLTTIILALTMMAGSAWAQNPDAIDNVRNITRSLQQKQTADSNAALAASGIPTAQAKQAPVVKPAVNPLPVVMPKQPAAPAKSAVAAKTAAKPAAAPKKAHAQTAAKAVSVKPAVKPVSHKSAAKPIAAPKVAKAPAAKPAAAAAPKPAEASAQPNPDDKKWAMTGKRDPFFSPVVQQQGGSGCSTGKKCLEIGQINVRGVVKSDSGFIAVVTNNLNKAYFLRENDPVFNGYVVRITGDSVVFQETFQDKLGKSFTREVVKRILTPAV